MVGLSTGLLAVGLAVLYGLGLVRSRGSALRLAGLAFMTGWAVTGIGLSLGLALGLAMTVGQTIALWLVLAASALLARVFRPAEPRSPRRETGQAGHAIALAGGGLLAVYLAALGVRSAIPSGFLHADAWNFWLPKAKTIYFFGGLDTGVGGFTSQTSPDYPPLLPAFEAAAFRFMGRDDVLDLPLFHWVVAVAFFAALAGLLAGRVRPAILWPSLVMLAFMPMVGRLIGSSLADEPLMMLFALAGVCGGLWLLERDWRLAAVAGCFLAAATLTKNEGLMLALIVALVLAVAARAPLAWPAALAAASLLAYLAWKGWLVRNDVPPNYAYDFDDLLRPGYLAGRFDRFEYGAESLLEQLLSTSKWLLTVPLTLVLAAALARARPALALFTLATPALAFLGYATVYWISSVELHFYVDNNVDRVVAPIVLFLASLFPLLLDEGLSRS